MKNILTTCVFCGCGCGYYIRVEDGRVTGVLPSMEHPIGTGSLCVKGWTTTDLLSSSERLSRPLVREGEGFREASWDEALDAVARGLSSVRERYGSDALAVMGSAKCTNEDNYVLQRFTRAVLGTNNIDHCARLCHAPTVAGLAASFGSGAMTNSIEEIAGADCILLTGSNPMGQHPQVASRIIRAVKSGASLIIVDPREIPLGRFARLYLRPRVGTDVAWCNGLLHIIIEEGLHNLEFIRDRTEGFEAMAEAVRDFTPAFVQEITGIPQALLREAARIYARSGRSCIVYCMGITQHVCGTDNVLSLANLAMACGQIGRPSTGVNPLRGQNNVQGACDMGILPDVLPGYQKVADEASREKFSRAWGRDLPALPGLTLVEMIDAAGLGKIRGMYIMGENPALSDPDLNHAREALSGLEFLAVQDLFLTETARYASVVLPSAGFAEKEGTFTSTERRIQRVRQAVPPFGESLPDWEILSHLSGKMGYPMGYRSSAEVMDEIARLIPFYGGISHRRLDTEGGLQWPCPSPDHPGTPILHVGRFSRGKGKFHAISYRPPAELPDGEYPFYLITGRIYFHWHTGTMTRKMPLLHRESPEGILEINPQDARSLGVREGGRVVVSSRRGLIITKAYSTEAVAPGTVFLPFHYYESAANLLTNPALDPVAKIPELKVCAVRIEPAGGLKNSRNTPGKRGN